MLDVLDALKLHSILGIACTYDVLLALKLHNISVARMYVVLDAEKLHSMPDACQDLVTFAAVVK